MQYKLEWNEGNHKHSLTGSAKDVQRELLPYMQSPQDRIDLANYLTGAEVGQTYGDFGPDGAVLWKIERIE